MGTRNIRAVVVMHFDEHGDLSVHVADPDGEVCVLTVDQRCPEDLVYEHCERQDPSEVLALAPRPWGSMHDDRHRQAVARVLFARDGLNIVVPDPAGGEHG